MLEEWKASTDRSLANTESILRSLGSRPTYTAKPFFAAPENLALFSAQAAPQLSLDRQKATLSGDIDRLFVQVKQELDSRSQAHQTKLDEFRNEIHSEVAARVVGVEEECTELKRRLAEEREKRSKLEKHVGGLLRWQEEAKYAMEDLRRKIEDVEESRSTDKRDLRKELAKREEQSNTAQAEIRKDLDYLRSCVVGKGAGKDGNGGEPSMRTIEQSLAAMHERCDKTEQLAASTKRDTTAALDNLQHDIDQKLKGADCQLEMHESKLQTLTEALNATKGQVQEATLVSDKLHDAVVNRREETQALQEIVKAVERKTATHEASIDRAQGMVKEVVHVIGAMSARLTEQLGTSTDPQHAPPAVASKVDELQALYEERFKDITAMIRHIGVTVRAQHLSMDAHSPMRNDAGRGGGAARPGSDDAKLQGSVLEKVMEELRKTKAGLENDMAALRAFTQQAVGGEGDLWQLQDDVAKLHTQVAPLKQQLHALQQQVCLCVAWVGFLSPNSRTRMIRPESRNP
jgi:DNA repair exonuclease SbcCD ATPase subunit